jgi:hypothetical protein
MGVNGSGKLIIRVLQAGVAEGGACIDLRVLRGARNRRIIRYGDQERAQFGADATWTA